MNRSMSLTTVVVLTAACVASATDFTVRIEPISPELIGPNSWVKYEITGLVENDGQNDGLAAFAVDLVTDTGVTQPEAFGGSSFGSFDRDYGLTNPDGFGGTPRRADLIQIGGAQNTIAYSGTDPSYPTGGVELNVARVPHPLRTQRVG